MTKLGEELRKKFKSPQDAIRALGLDADLLKREILIAKDSKESLMSKPTRLAAIALKGTAIGIRPLLALDAQVDWMPIFKDVSTKTFDSKKLLASISAAIKGKTIAQDVNIEHVAKMLDHVGEAGTVDPASADESVSEEQHKAMMAAAEGKSNLGIPKKVGEEFQKADTGKGFDAEPMKSFMREKGMSEDDITKCMDMMPAGSKCAPEGASDESEEEKKAREDKEAKAAKDKKAADKAAKDAEMKDMVSKGAMDEAIAEVKKAVRETERGIRSALSDVGPWVGNLSATLAFDSRTDVLRHAAGMLNVANSKTMHPDALWPVIQAQPKPGAQPARETSRMALGLDSASKSKATKYAPGLENITVGA